MAYIGGKSKCYEHIIKYLNDPRYDNMEYLYYFLCDILLCKVD